MKLLLKGSCIVLGCLFLSACLRMPYQPQAQYLLNVPCPAYRPQVTKIRGPVLLERPIVLSPYSSANFIYRVSDVNYITDYYSVFLTPVSEQIYQATSRCLTGTKLFNQVIESDALVKPDYWLNTKVLALYADYRDKLSPKGVLTVQFVLYQRKPDQSQPSKVFDKTYQESIRLGQKYTCSLINAWNEGLRRALQSFFMNLSSSA